MLIAGGRVHLHAQPALAVRSFVGLRPSVGEQPLFDRRRERIADARDM